MIKILTHLASGKNARGFFLARVYDPWTPWNRSRNSGGEGENASFRVYPGSLAASINARDCARDSYMVQARLRNERVLLFNPLQLFRII